MRNNSPLADFDYTGKIENHVPYSRKEERDIFFRIESYRVQVEGLKKMMALEDKKPAPYKEKNPLQEQENKRIRKRFGQE